jgi:hypothetical protein
LTPSEESGLHFGGVSGIFLASAIVRLLAIEVLEKRCSDKA